MHRRHTVICPPDRSSGHCSHKHTNLAIWALNAFLVKAKKILEQRVTWSLIQPTLALSIQNFTYLIATIEKKDDISGN